MKRSTLSAMILSIALLSACGGGGGDSNAPPSTNSAPVASAGADQSVLVNAVVTLDGSKSSDANSDPLTYAWTLSAKPAGSAAALTNPTSAKPTFTADAAGAYVATLVVNDGKIDSAPDTANVSASVDNAAPVANAGVAQNVAVFSVVTLDGSASSDANSDPLTYAWTLTARPAGSAATLSSASSAKPTFTADVAGTYSASLLVNDGKVNSSNAATVSIAAAVANVAPVANAGVAQNVAAGTVVTLNGSTSSDANGDSLTYAWTLTSKPAGSSAALVSPTSAKPTFTADVAGTYVASLIVNDGKVNSSVATVGVTATAANALILLSPPDLFCLHDCVDTPVAFPYANSAAVSVSSGCVGMGIVCPAAYTIASFKLRASGQSYTITNLQARNTTSGSSITPMFNGLTNGQTIAAGETVPFSLESLFTGGRTVNLTYSFTVQETGATFSYTVQLQTN